MLFMQWFSQYGPDYTLHSPPGNKQDKNTAKYLTELVDTISGNNYGVMCAVGTLVHTHTHTHVRTL